MPILIDVRYNDGIQLTQGALRGVCGSTSSDYYLAWRWSTRALGNGVGALTVESVPNGFWPAYYKYDAYSFVLSTDIKDLISGSLLSHLDPTFFSLFIKTGLILEDRTIFRKVYAMPEGGEVVWIPGRGIHIRPRSPAEPLKHLSIDHAAREIGQLFREKVASYATRSINIPLSGGRDSRHIASELCRSGHTVDASATIQFFPPKKTNDIEIAKTVAATLGLHHIALQQRNDAVHAQGEILSRNNFSFLEGNWKVALSDFFDSHKCDIFDGIGGDVLLAGLFTPSANESQMDLDVSNLISSHSDTLNMLSEKVLGFRLASDEEIGSILRTVFVKYKDDHNPVSSFYLWNRTRRQIASNTVGVFGTGRIFAPFLAEPFFSCARGLPLEYIQDKTFHDRVMKQYNPEVCETGLAINVGCAIPLRNRLCAASRVTALLLRAGLGGKSDTLLPDVAKMAVSSSPWRTNKIVDTRLLCMLFLAASN